MSIVTNAYNKILEGIQYLRDVGETTQNFIETTTTIVVRTYNFLEPIFSFLPWEVILLLIASVFLLSWVNGVFPTSPKLNFTLIVGFLCFAWGYSESRSLPEGADVLRILRTAAYLLIPIHALGILGLGWRQGKKFYEKRKRTHSRDWGDFLTKFQQSSHKIQSMGHGVLAGDELSEEEIQTRLEELEILVRNWRLGSFSQSTPIPDTGQKLKSESTSGTGTP